MKHQENKFATVRIQKWILEALEPVVRSILDNREAAFSVISKEELVRLACIEVIEWGKKEE